MAKSEPAEPGAPSAPSGGGYLEWSRDPAVGLFAVLPLWLLYELLRAMLTPDERNGAELLLLRELDRLGVQGLLVLRLVFFLLAVWAARSLVRRRVPWARVAGVLALEGAVYGLMLGPVSAAMASSFVRVLSAPAGSGPLLADLVGSLGAGIFEELVFRLGLMSLLVWIGVRAIRAWSLPVWIVGAGAVLVSALVFSWFHHLCGEPYDARRFLFRTMAGLLLGVLMWLRGFGVCVYTHTVYNVYFYLVNE
ncbi:MAG: CPBP family intramembrane metalloprotease [Planctomycetes bacterium]|nr:CPBP family intramembrane metalloprotease [Planctomycetota bacterium]